MGIKVINTIIGLNIGAAAAYVIGLMTPMHSISFFGALGGIRVARMWTKLMSVNFETQGHEFCKAVEAIAERLGSPQRGQWCADLTNTNDLQAVQQRMCSQLWTTVWPSFCDGLEWAYTLGMVLTVIFIVNFIVMGASMYMLNDYGHGKHKRQKRRSSMITLAIGLVVVVVFLFMYGLLAIGGLSDIDTANSLSWFNGVLAVSRGVGFSYGFVMLWLGALLQVISLCLWHQTRKNGEDDIHDAWMAKKFFREQMRYGAIDEFAPIARGDSDPSGRPDASGWSGQSGYKGSGMPGAFAQGPPGQGWGLPQEQQMTPMQRNQLQPPGYPGAGFSGHVGQLRSASTPPALPGQRFAAF